MNKTRIAFFGTSDRSVPIIEALKSNFDLVLCVTKKDSLVGRKQEVRQTEVKKWAIKNNIEYIEVDTLKGEESLKVIEKMKEQNIDYGVVADFSLMVPSSIIETYRNKLINIHFSLLPKYRGASPVQFALLNGDKTTGITFQLLENKMDTGAIISNIEYTISTKQNSGELYKKLFEISAEKLPEILKNFFSGKITPILQDEKTASYTYSRSHPKNTFIFKEDAEIDWSKTPEEIERAVRAFNPWPIAWTTLGNLEKATNLLSGNFVIKDEINKNLKVKIHEAEILNNKLQINKLQIEGKNIFTWKDFENGYFKK